MRIADRSLNAWRCYWANPLCARALRPWRRWADWRGALAAGLAVVFVAIAAGAYPTKPYVIPWEMNIDYIDPWYDLPNLTGPLISPPSPGRSWSWWLGGVAQWTCVIGMFALPLIAAAGVQRLRESRSLETLRVTPLTARQVVDGCFWDTLLRAPLWLPAGLLLVVLYARAMLFWWVSFQLSSPGELTATESLWLTGVDLMLQVMGIMAQLAVSVMLGVAAGLLVRSPSAAAGLALATIAVLQISVAGRLGTHLLPSLVPLYQISYQEVRLIYLKPLLAVEHSSVNLLYQVLLLLAARAAGTLGWSRGGWRSLT